MTLSKPHSYLRRISGLQESLTEPEQLPNFLNIFLQIYLHPDLDLNFYVLLHVIQNFIYISIKIDIYLYFISNLDLF